MLLFAFQGDSSGNPTASHKLEPLGTGGSGSVQEVTFEQAEEAVSPAGGAGGPVLCQEASPDILCGCPCPCSHKDSMAQVEAVVRRAVRASNASSELLQNLLEGNAAWDVQRELENG